MSNPEKTQHYLDVLKRLEKCHTDVISINNSNNPFSVLLMSNSKDVFEVILLYKQFDKLRNSIREADKIQGHFEEFLEETENVIMTIRDSARSIAETGLRFGSLEEANTAEFGKMLKKQFQKFKQWISNKIEKISELKELIKDDMSYIEKEIQREFSKIK
jgi:hypothetical protein